MSDHGTMELEWWKMKKGVVSHIKGGCRYSVNATIPDDKLRHCKICERVVKEAKKPVKPAIKPAAKPPVKPAIKPFAKPQVKPTKEDKPAPHTKWPLNPRSFFVQSNFDQCIKPKNRSTNPFTTNDMHSILIEYFGRVAPTSASKKDLCQMLIDEFARITVTPVRVTKVPSQAARPSNKPNIPKDNQFPKFHQDPMESIAADPDVVAAVKDAIAEREEDHPSIRTITREMRSDAENDRIVKVLNQVVLRKQFIKMQTGDNKISRSITSLKRAINAIKQHGKEITDARTLRTKAGKIKFVGDGTIRRIELILSGVPLEELRDTDLKHSSASKAVVRKLLKQHNLRDYHELLDSVLSDQIGLSESDLTDEINNDIKLRIMMDLTSIHGVGDVRAHTIVDKNTNIRGVRDLISRINRGEEVEGLTTAIRTDLMYHDDLQLRIPYDEIRQADKFLQAAVKAINPALRCIICGSHRRMVRSSGDMDVLIVDPALKTAEDVSKSMVLRDIKRELKGFLIGDLTSKGKTKYMGICRVADGLPARRIDIRLVHRNAFAAALLYFTGSSQFNQIMRFIANQRGYTLNEYGIRYYHAGNPVGDYLPVHTERDIFNILGIRYVRPDHRDM